MLIEQVYVVVGTGQETSTVEVDLVTASLEKAKAHVEKKASTYASDYTIEEWNLNTGECTNVYSYEIKTTYTFDWSCY